MGMSGLFKLRKSSWVDSATAGLQILAGYGDIYTSSLFRENPLEKQTNVRMLKTETKL